MYSRLGKMGVAQIVVVLACWATALYDYSCGNSMWKVALVMSLPAALGAFEKLARKPRRC